MGLENIRTCRDAAAKAAAVLLALAALSGCSGGDLLGVRPEPQSPPPPAAPPPPAPPPINLAGRWKLSAATGGACLMTFGAAPGAVQGTIAPEGGCPGNFFTSRKWAFENDRLIIRNHKGELLAQLSYAADRFEGQDTGGAAVSLARSDKTAR